MKKFIKIISAIALAASAVFATGCTDTFEELDVIVLKRCLEPTGLSAKVVSSRGNDVVFNWNVGKDTEAYTLVVCTDKEMTDVYDEKTLTPDQIPFTMTLQADATYYFKVQATSASKDPSNWVIYADDSKEPKSIKTFAVKDNLYLTVAERAAGSVTLAWSKEVSDYKDVTAIVYGAPGCAEEDLKTYELTQEDIEAASATLSGLAASSEYVATLFYLSASRGEVNVWTMPDPNGLAVVTTSAQLTQAIVDGASALVKMDGSPYTIGADIAKGLDTGKGFKLYGEGAADGTMPVIQGSLNITDAFDGNGIYAEGIEFDGLDNTCGFLLQHKEGGAVDNVPVGDVIFRNCVIKGYSKGLFYEWGKSVQVGKFYFDGCDIHAVNVDGSGGGDGFDIRQATSIDELSFTHCTIYNGFRTLLRLDPLAVIGALTFDNNTVMNVCFVDNANNGGIFGLQMVPGSMSVRNNLFLNLTGKATLTAQNTKYKTAGDLGLNASSNYFYGCAETISTSIMSVSDLAGSTLGADPCYNANAGLFNLNPDSEIAGGKIGASKWWTPYVEAPEDLTLHALAGKHTWDLTNAKFFSGTSKKQMVRDSLYIKASENNPISLSDGRIGFQNASVCTRKGLPTDGFIYFKVNKPGSVLIRPVEGGANHLVIATGAEGASTVTVKGGASELTDMGNAQKILVSDVTEETCVYIYASGPIAIDKLAWSNDVNPVNTALPAPEPEVKPASVIAGEPQDITVSWAPVENAASYSVVFSGKTYAVEENSYTIASSVVGMLDPGSYKVLVYANPGTDDIYNTMSEAGAAAFAVQPAGGSEGGTEFVVSSVEELLTAIDAGKTDITLKYSDTPYAIGELTLTTPLRLSGQTSGEKKTPVSMSLVISGQIGGSVVLKNLDITNEVASVIKEDATVAPEVDTVAIRSCYIHGTKALYDNSGKAVSCVQVLRIEDNVVEGCSDGADFIDLRKGAHHTVTIVNNTFANSCRTFIRTDAVHELNYLTVRNNTFYKVATNSSSKDNNGIFHVRSTGGAGLLEYKVANNIFYSILIDTEPSNPAGFPKFRSKGGLDPVTVINNYFYNCEDREEKAAYSFWSYFSKDAAIAGGGAILPADPFKDAAGGDYTLVNGVAMNANVGDPRWNPMRGSVPGSEITVKNTEEFLTAISAGKSSIALAAGQYNLVEVSAEGTDVVNGKLSISSSLNLSGQGDAEIIGGFIFKAGVKNFTVTNLTLNGKAEVDNVFEVAEDAVDINRFSVKDSEVKNYKNRLFYMGKVGHVASVEFCRNIFSGEPGADFTSGDFIDIRKGTANAIQFHNNTLYNAGRTFLRADANAVVNSVLVANNTFYNMCYVDSKDNNGFFHVRSTALPDSEYIVRDNIFAGMHRAAETPSNAVGYPKLVSTNAASKLPVFRHNYYYDLETEVPEYSFWTKDKVTVEKATAEYGIVLAETPFKDAANGDFTLVNSLAASEKVGDPRWNASAGRNPSESFEVADVEEMLMAISAGKTNITLTGESYDLIEAVNESIASGVLSVTGDLTINGKLTHGVKPVLIGGFKCLATEGGLVLNNLHLVGTKTAEGASDVVIGNMIDIDKTAVLSKLTIRDCDIEKYGNRMISGSGESSCGPVLVQGNYVSEFGTGGDFIDFRKGGVSSIKIVRNTFANGIRTFLRCDAVVVCGAITVENNTFYNLGAVDSKDNNGILHIRSTAATSNPRQIVVKRNIFASMHRAVETPANAAAGFPHLISRASAAIAVPTITDNIFFDIDDVENYGWWMYLPEGHEEAKATVITETPFAADPATGKFTVKSEYKGYGDIRW